jgi:hypothetical protein
MIEAGAIARLDGALDRGRPIFQGGPVQDGPVELWLVVVDARQHPLAVGPVDLGALRPEAIGGVLNLVGGPTELAVIDTGHPGAPLGTTAEGWLVMVNRADGAYARVFPLEFAVPQVLREGDRLTVERWEWSIRRAEEAP